MSLWILLILCVVQGLTEFLPVSSSGHLLFFEQVFGVTENLMFLNLFLHLATLLAVVIVYRKTILNLIKKPFQAYTYKLILATLFSVILAFVYEFSGVDKVITKIYPFAFLLTSILLFMCHLFQKKAVAFNTNEISVKNSIIVGIVQGFAVVPGLSRSGSTISSLILTGNDEKSSAEFSFLLSIPIIVGGFVLELIQLNKSGLSFESVSIGSYFLAFLLTFIVALIALKITLKILKNHKFIIFSIYTFVMFIVTFVFNYVI
ncbi:MAG: undecaprenyl-diphosphate phosphatase [Clostridia bacterium]|nr:undecaprenyl-diphosphate phosphatase [Clostridia bacterium]